MDSFDQLLTGLDQANANLSQAADNLKAARLALFGDNSTTPADIDDDTRAPHWGDVVTRITRAVRPQFAPTTAHHVTDESESIDDL